MRKLLFAFLMPLSLLAQAGGQPIVIPIQNPSFEQGATSWNFIPSSGVMQLNGVPVAYAGYKGSFWQDLGVSPLKIQQRPDKPQGYNYEGVYTLKFQAANYFPHYPGYYEVKLSFGTQELCEASRWGMADLTEVTLSCTSSGYLISAKSLPGGGPAQGQQNFVLTFHVDDGSPNGGWPVNATKFSLTFKANP